MRVSDRVVYRALIATSRKETFLKTMKDIFNMKIIDDYIVLEAPE